MATTHQVLIRYLICLCNLTASKRTAVILGSLTAGLAFGGFLWEGEGLLRAWYKAMAFTIGNYNFESIDINPLLKIALILDPLFAVSALLSIFAKKLGLALFVNFQKDYSVVCGLGRMGTTLAHDMLNQKLNLLVIEPDGSNPNAQDILSRGGQVIFGDALSEETLKRANLKNAKEIILASGDDATNLEILSKMLHFVGQETAIYVHLQDRQNYEFLEKSAKLKNHKIKHFSLYDNAAIDLILKYPIAYNIDMTKPENRARIAVVGFDAMALALLYRLLALGHFYNGNPLQVVVFNDEPLKSEKEFLEVYPINLKEPNLWELDFRDEAELYQGKDLNFCEIIFCGKQKKSGLLESSKLIKNHPSILENTLILVFAEQYGGIGDLMAALDQASSQLETSAKDLKNFKTFGDFLEICSYDVIVNERLDQMAKQVNEGYNKLHGYNNDWNKIGIFLQDSSRMQALHLGIKISAILRLQACQEDSASYEEIKEEAKKRWLKFGEEAILWDKIKGAKEIVQLLGADRLEKLTKSEKYRWNAFHLLNGWKKLEHQEGKDFKKDEVAKQHPCIVSWEELDFVSEKHGRDYKIDDAESITKAYELITHAPQLPYIQAFKQKVEQERAKYGSPCSPSITPKDNL